MADRLAPDREEVVVEQRLKELAELAGPTPDLLDRVAGRSAALRRRRTSVIGAGAGVVGAIAAATVTVVVAGTGIRGTDGRDDLVTVPAMSSSPTGTPAPAASTAPTPSASSIPTTPAPTLSPTRDGTPNSPRQDTSQPPVPVSPRPAVSTSVPLYSPPPGYYSPPPNPPGTLTIEGTTVRSTPSTFQVEEWVRVVNNGDVACRFSLSRGGSVAIFTGPIEPGGGDTMRMPATAGTYDVVCAPDPAATDRPAATGTVVLEP
ncbi:MULTISPECIES: hypothetical protein [unclassified Pseudofrankia]|uniref:hypothetical protein n=1 Tax=unclassified Pseudofrankia TaxID=2994372 RepID=UPI0008D8E416|nr:MULTISPECIES: hypothetical protein [unclassified Pseudofrankia]MDT3445215.1 hypothetical protein [Pseudofrankia sp. BMG5.37]OHV63313.1 hypothetical protein BCD48_04900 [Pseudofrankia sp. BMG5.36]